MDNKKVMTCGECLKYAFCPVANHNTNHKACMKITTTENYTIEQNAGENQIEGGVVSISGSVAKQYRPFKDCDELVECWEKKIFIPAMQYTKQKVLFRPGIWVKSKSYGTDNLITAFDGDAESIGGSCVFVQDVWLDMQELFDNFTFLDGSPCGKEE